MTQHSTTTIAFLQGGGKMAQDIARFDWAATSLGPISDWPAVLKITISTMVNSAFPKCLCWGPDLIMIYNDAFTPILERKHPCLGQPFLDVWSDVADDIRPIAQAALAGQSTYIEDFPLETNRSGTLKPAHFTFCYSPIRDENGVVCGMLDTVIETTGKVSAENLSRLRNQELVHRSRNAYALVSALVSQTFRSERAPGLIRDTLQRRIQSLVHAQDLLMDSATFDGQIEVVARRALDPFMDETEKLQFIGPAVVIGREQVTAFSLALHEMATNSIKYGALSLATGRVLIRWDFEQIEGARRFVFVWQETGGPTLVAPTSTGFGTRIVRGTLPDAFGGTVTLDYDPRGLILTLSTDPARLRND